MRYILKNFSKRNRIEQIGMVHVYFDSEGKFELPKNTEVTIFFKAFCKSRPSFSLIEIDDDTPVKDEDEPFPPFEELSEEKEEAISDLSIVENPVEEPKVEREQPKEEEVVSDKEEEVSALLPEKLKEKTIKRGRPKSKKKK